MEDNIHPLTIDLVAQEILRHVSPSMKDLLVFRQVCRLWRELATPVISSRGLELPVITFKAEGAEGSKTAVEKMVGEFFSMVSKLEGVDDKDKIKVDCFNCYPLDYKDMDCGCVDCNADFSSLPKYIDYLEMDFYPKIPFSVLHFNGISLDHPIVKEFLQGFGHTVKKLFLNQLDEEYSLRRCPEQGKVNHVTFRNLLLACPELEELVLGCVDPQNVNVGFLLHDDDFATKIKRVAWVEYMELEPTKPHEMFISDLLEVCPSLERFVIAEDIDSRFVRAISNSQHLSSMKELTLHFGAVHIFETLLKGKLRLKKLKFHRMYVSRRPELFRRFLDTQKSSLETLIMATWQVCVFASNETPERPIQFPDGMEKLKVLKIGDIDSKERIFSPDPIFRRLLLQPLDFRRQFPALRTLILGGEARRYELHFLFVPGTQPQLVLEGLQLPGGIGHAELARIGRFFPNVKELKLKDVTAEALRVLFSQWPRMESLFLDLKVANIETSLTGLSSPQVPVDALNRDKKQINIPTDNPSITNFQDLKELWILKGNKNKILPDLPGAFLSDVSIHYSLSKLPNLEFLAANEHKFTEEGINHLCNARGLKWKKDSSTEWPFQWQKNLELEHKPRPNFNEDFYNYKMRPGSFY